jgi:ferredoxin-type protein NapH
MSLEILGNILPWTIAVGSVLAGVLVILIWKRDKTKKVSYLRYLSRIVSFGFIYWLFTINIWLALILISIFVATLFVGRFFCGWVCPFGLYMDIVSTVREKLGIGYWRFPDKPNNILNKLRYPILLFFLLLPFYVDYSKMTILPFALFFIGPYKPLMILAAPIETLIVPWTGGPISIPGYTLSINYPYLPEINYYASGVAYAGLAGMITFVIITLAGSFLVRRFWCRFCPTGASLAVINRFKVFRHLPLMYINKIEEKCTKCGVCKRVCPVQVTEVYEKKGGDITTSMCMLCLRCVEMCPYEDTLKVQLAGKTVFRSRNWLEPSNIE